MEESVLDAAEQAILEVGIPTLPREVLKVFGRLKFRTSFGQNVLQHSIEVAHIAAALAAKERLFFMILGKHFHTNRKVLMH